MGGGTQYTVNNQMVNATLMNIADSPTNVQLPGVYKTEEIPRVPIICTGTLLLRTSYQGEFTSVDLLSWRIICTAQVLSLHIVTITGVQKGKAARL